ncbi:MAG: hypothetical protein ACTSXW_01770 [Candidatus Baldrarchaeia archaeon]
MAWIREIQKLKQVEELGKAEYPILHRYFWLYYLICVVYLMMYMIFYTYEVTNPAWRIAVFYSLLGIMSVFPIYALQRRETEKELRKLSEIFKLTEENINLLLEIILMSLIGTIIFISIMIIPGLELSAVIVVTVKEAVILELAKELRLKIQWWLLNIFGNYFMVAFGEETFGFGLATAVGLKFGKNIKGQTVAQTIGAAWVLFHAIWWPAEVYYLYLICLAIVRSIFITLYFIPIRIEGKTYRMNILSAIFSHGTNNALATLIAAGVIFP